MTLRSESLTAIHQRIRQAWRRQVVPAYRSREASALLAALVVADASLDAALLAEGYDGETMGERLRAASRSFGDYPGLRAARHVRHQAVHELDYHLCWRAGAEALAAYAHALWEHGVDLSDIWYPADDIDAAPSLVLLSPHSEIGGKGTTCERGVPAIAACHLAATGAAQ